MKIKNGAAILAAACILLSGCAGQAAKSSTQGLEAYRNGDYARAAVLFSQAITQDGTDSSYQVNLGMSRLGLEQFDEARAAFTRALELGGSDFYARRGLGLTAMGQGDYAEACSWFDEAFDMKEASAAALERDLLCYRAEARALNHQLDKALEDYEKLAQSGYRPKEIYILMGDACAREKDTEAAFTWYQKSLDIDSSDFQSFLHMAEVLEKAGAEEERSTVLTAALQIISDKPEDICCRGRCLLGLGREQEAFAAFEQAYNSGCPEAGLFLGYCYELRGNDQEAIRLYLDMIAESPENPDAYNALAECYVRAGQYEDALTIIEKGLLLAEDSRFAKTRKALLWNKCICCERAGKRQDAVTALMTFVSLYPEDERGTRELVFLRSRK